MIWVKLGFWNFRVTKNICYKRIYVKGRWTPLVRVTARRNN